MKDEDKTRDQLINELEEMRRQAVNLKSSEAGDSEAVLEALAGNSTIGVYIVQEGKFIFTNDMFQRYVGYSEEELLGMESLSIVYPEDRDMVRENAIKMLKGQSTSPYEFRYVNKNGECLWVMESVSSVRYQGRRSALGSFIDTTQRRLIEERYKNLLVSMNDGYAVVQQGKITFANRRLGEIFGYSIEQLMGMPFTQLVLPEFRWKAAAWYEKVDKDKNAVPNLYQTVGIKEDGTEIKIEWNANFIQYEGKVALSVIVRDITGRSEIEEKYRQLVEDMNDGYGLIQDGKFIFTNDRFVEILGYKPGQGEGKPMDYFFSPESRQNIMAITERVVFEGELPPENHEATMVRQDGTTVIVEASIRKMDYKGKQAFSILMRDITHRKQLEENYKQLLDDMTDAYFVVQDGKIVFANRRFSDIYGYEPERVVGMPLTRTALPEERQAVMEKYEEVINGSTLPRELFEGVGLKKDNTSFIGEASVRLINYHGKPAVGAIARDVTERKRMEEALRESEEKLRLIFESVPEGIIISDLEGNIIDANSNAVSIHGYDSKEELLGQKGTIFMTERDYAQAMEGKNKLMKGISSGVIQSIFVKKDGTEFPVMLSSAVIKDSAGQPSSIVSIIVDITEQQKRQEQLMLTDRLASIGQLAAGIAHEINNPLTAVIGISQLLTERDIPEEIREDIEIIDAEAQRAANVVRGLLTFVRSKGNEKFPEDINNIIGQVLKMRAYEQSVHNIWTDIRFATGLPSVNISGSQMQQVFMNIIVNAEQAMLDAHGKGRLEVITENVGDVIRVYIRDDGPGIAPDNMKKLFTPFFTTKEVGKGTGLGLSISHGIVKEHGGRVYAESKPGEGATFIIELPLYVNNT